MSDPSEQETNPRTSSRTAAELRPVRGIGWRVTLARLALMWERLWPRLWPALGIAGLFATAVLLDIFPMLPGWLHALLLAGFVLVFATALWRGLRRLRWPGGKAAERRLERDSGLSHRPLETLADRPAVDATSPLTQELWLVHLARTRALVRRLRLKLPHPNMARYDPRALRLAVALGVIIGVFAGAYEAGPRLARALTPDIAGLGTAPAATLELWVTPPKYTNIAPRLLTPADGVPAGDLERSLASGEAIALPAGSRLLAQIGNVRRTPEMRVGETSVAFEAVGERAWRTETDLLDAGQLNVEISRSSGPLGRWLFDIVRDEPPEIIFAAPPEASQRFTVGIEYAVRDDYGVVAVAARLTRPAGQATPRDKPLEIDLSLPTGDPRDGSGSNFHDLTAHPWAGLPVEIQLLAEDAAGQRGVSDKLALVLPERPFQHPVAREIIEQRRELTMAPDQYAAVAEALGAIAGRPGRYGNDVAVYLGLTTSRSRLFYDRGEDAIESVIRQLWDIALHLEEGGLAIAERELRDIQRRLQDALARGADDEEIAELMDELREALERYTQALMEEALRNGQLSERPEDFGQDPNSQTIDQQTLQEMLDRIEQLARSGNRDAARQMLSQLQRMLENMQNRAMSRQQQGQDSEAREMMRELQDIIRQQQELYDRSFNRNQRGEADPDADKADAEAQNELRRKLGELMRQLGERMGRIPQNLGNAERAMREAEQALESGGPGEAIDPQARALEDLRQGGQNMAMQLFRQQQPGPGDPTGPGYGPAYESQRRDPLGRPLPEDSSDGSSGGGFVQIPDESAAERALRIQQDLRERLGDTGRSNEEIEYLLRLLRRF